MNSSWTEFIWLSPDDDAKTFYTKLCHLPKQRLTETVQRFEKYAKYATLLKFYQVALQQSKFNIQLKYNYKYGWHLSSCIQSTPENPIINYLSYKEDLSHCECDKAIAAPNEFFSKLERERKVRCKSCKRYIPQWNIKM